MAAKACLGRRKPGGKLAMILKAEMAQLQALPEQTRNEKRKKMSDKMKPTFRREVKRIVEFNTPSGVVTLVQEAGQVSMHCSPGRLFVIPEEDLGRYIEALTMMQFHIQVDPVRGTGEQ